MAVTPDLVRRLAFAKYLFNVGLEHAQRPAPLNAVALLMFHDAAELFLQIASEHLDVGKQQVPFLAYWELLSSRTADPLSQKEAMRRLNKSRVALKHDGTLPSALDIGSFRETVTCFLEENTPRIFGLTFAELSLVDFVGSPVVRARLQNAEKASAGGRMEDALADVAVAFQQLLDSYEKPKSRWGGSPFTFGADFRFPITPVGFARQEKDPVVYQFMEATRGTIRALQEVAKMLSLGIDYRRFARFRMHMPFVSQTMDGEYHVTFPYPIVKITSDEDFDFCFNFVIETALALAEFDFELPKIRQPE